MGYINILHALYFDFLKLKNKWFHFLYDLCFAGQVHFKDQGATIQDLDLDISTYIVLKHHYLYALLLIWKYSFMQTNNFYIVH